MWGSEAGGGGGEIFRTCPDRPWGPPSLLYNKYRIFPRGKERPARDAGHLTPSSVVVRKSRAIPLLPLWVVRPVQGLSASIRVHLYLKHTSLFADPFWLQKITTNPHILADVNIEFPILRCVIPVVLFQ